MPILRLTQFELDNDRNRVEIALEGAGARQTATAEFAFAMTPQDRNNLQWYLEDYLQHPHDPAPAIAARIEKRMEELGCELFNKVFLSRADGTANQDASRLWSRVEGNVNDLRVEVATSVRGATAVPWELLRDPHTRHALATSARVFVRTHTNPMRPSIPPRSDRRDSPIRILLVICRPGAEDDVPFRSVASRLLKSLTEQARAVYQLDVLRPPTFDRLGDMLQRATSDGQSYDVVHFDGHGAFLDMAEVLKQWREKGEKEALNTLTEKLPLDSRRFSPADLYPHQPVPGEHGYLVFENPAHTSNYRLVDGGELGRLLAACNVPVLVLNACRSAQADAPDAPPSAAPGDTTSENPHSQVQAFGSLAQQAVDQGLAGLVAMRYNVYVVTAAKFVADLYAELVRGRPLGEAATLARKRLESDPSRSIAYNPIALQDWMVPVVYETEPIRLFSAESAGGQIQIEIRAGQTTAAAGSLDSKLPRPPDAGFFGRDETILALDRAFDTQHVVLLHAYAGSGKTATAAEFARWYSVTGGIHGPVLFTTFEQHLSLAQVLDLIGQVFGPVLEQKGIHWLALDDAARRAVALQVLGQVPVLWIWDNVEPVAGFPAGTPSPWSAEEQRELADFLRDCRTTKAKFLLTSRRDERAWLDDLPRRIAIRPMPMQERVELARALAEKAGRQLADVEDWRPLLRFTEGNPLTITALVRQALRDNLQTREQIEAFVEALRSGEAAFDDEQSEGRTRSLGAALAYGFEHAFNDDERRQLALLHFFQGFVNVDALRVMGDPAADWCLPEVRGLTRDAGISLFDRAAEVGLLTAIGQGYYAIHPAVPWFFRQEFGRHFPPVLGSQSARANPALAATRAFVEATGRLGNFYHDEYSDGNCGAIAVIQAEESNMLYARRLARQNDWWNPLTSVMQGLHVLYAHTGRRSEWRRLVEEIVPDFVEPVGDGPLPGREARWSLVTGYRVDLAREMRQWQKANDLQQVRVDWNRRRAHDAITRLEQEAGLRAQATAPCPLSERIRRLGQKVTGNDRNEVRILAVSLGKLGDVRRELLNCDCVTAYREALELMNVIDDRAGAAPCAFNLGNAYKDLKPIRNLDEAERWYREGLRFVPDEDVMGRARCIGQLGAVALERFDEALAARRPEVELRRYLRDALKAYNQVLAMLPENAFAELAVTRNQLGLTYGQGRDFERALTHFREAIRYMELSENRFGAGQARMNVAVVLAELGQLPDAREYALATLRDFESYGAGAAEKFQETKRLLDKIEQKLQPS